MTVQQNVYDNIFNQAFEAGYDDYLSNCSVDFLLDEEKAMNHAVLYLEELGLIDDTEDDGEFNEKILSFVEGYTAGVTAAKDEELNVYIQDLRFKVRIEEARYKLYTEELRSKAADNGVATD